MVVSPRILIDPTSYQLTKVTTFASCYDEKNPRYQFQKHPESCFILFQPEEFLGFLGGGRRVNIFGIFTPKLGEMIQFDEHIFQMG